MRHRIAPLLVGLALVLTACGDGGDGETTTSPSTTTTPDGGDVSRRDVLDAEVLALAEGDPPAGGDEDEVRVLDPDDPDAAAELFVEAERDEVRAAVGGADVDGRTLLGGVIHVGCFPAGEVVVAVVEGELSLDADRLDPQEGEVECYRAVVTAAVVSVRTADLPAGLPTEPTVDPGPSGALPGELALLEEIPYQEDDAPGPGLVRDRVDLEAVLARYGLEEPDRALLGRVETGDEVLVAGVVGGGCALPDDVRVGRVGGDLSLVEEDDPEGPDLDCDAVVHGLALVAIAAEDVGDAATVQGDPVDGPTGVGVIASVEPVEVGTDPSAERGEDGRLTFVVEACAPDTAELVADLAAGTVRAEAQQEGFVACDAYSPYEVVADLLPAYADLEPVVG